MPSVEEQLRRWREAGVLDQASVERIQEFERSREKAEQPGERPGVLEALTYLGVAAVAVGAYALAAQHWDSLERWARIASPAVPGLLAVLAGVAMRGSDEPGIARAAHIAWLAALGLLAGAVGIGCHEYDVDDRYDVLLVGVAATVLGLGLWAVEPSHPQVIGVGAGLVALASGVADWTDDHQAQLAGVVIFLVGAAGVGLAEVGWLRPRISARLVLGLLAAAGMYVAGTDGSVLWAELSVFVVGGALIGLSIVRSAFAYMVLGVGAIFVGLVTFIFEHFEDEIGAPVALTLSGAIIIAGVLILARVRAGWRAGVAA